MERHCPARGRGQGSVDGWKAAWGASFTPISLFSEVVALLHPQRKRGRGRPLPRPPGVAAEGPQRRSSRLPWQPEASSPYQRAACRLLPGWSRVRRVPALSPRPLPGKRSPAPSPRPLPSPPRDSGWGRGNPARQVPAAHTLPGSPRRTTGPGGEAARPKHPALGTAPGARRSPYLLDKGAPQPGPRESTPSAPREGARRAAALRFPGAVARSGRARRAHPGPVSAVLVPAGGAGWAAGVRVPRPRSGSRAPLRPPGLRGARLRPGRPPPPSHALARRDRASLLSLRLRSPLRLLPPPASQANLRTGLTLQTSASGLGQKRGSETGTRGRRPGRGAPARWPGAATWSGHPP